VTEQTEPITLDDVRRLQLQPGDVVITDHRLSMDARRRIVHELAGVWPDNRVLVLDGGVELEIVTPERAA
jgi:hypothetical protein